MSGCLENFACEDFCRCCANNSEHCNQISSVAAGTLFFIGWWFAIDAAVSFPNSSELHPAVHMCGVVGTIALFMVNGVSNGLVRGESYYDGCLNVAGARAIFFMGFMLHFGALIAASIIFFSVYVVPGKAEMNAGICIFMQNILILIASLVFKFGRNEDA